MNEKPKSNRCPKCDGLILYFGKGEHISPGLHPCKCPPERHAPITAPATKDLREIEELLKKHDPKPSSVSAPTWLPIESAPKDGTHIDVWRDGEMSGRWTDVFWGKPDHECGEMGEYCDSDWHGLAPGWVCSTFQETLHFEPTHWMALPLPPATPS